MNDSIRYNLNKFIEELKHKNINFQNENFVDFDFSSLSPMDFVYADSPYSVGVGVYQDGKRGFNGWSKDDENRLCDIFDELNGRKVKWAMSNMLENKGVTNCKLYNWSKKYHIHDMKINYNGANYQRKTGTSREVLITNY